MSNGPLIHSLISRHLDWFLEHAPMYDFGPLDCQAWVSSLDLETGRMASPERPAGIEKRCYRYIESPGGSNLYWDLPLVAFCREYAQQSWTPRIAEAAMNYVEDYLHEATDASGLFHWGNHYYLDAASGRIAWFMGEELIPGAPPDARYHETRPLRVPWAVFGPNSLEAAHRSIQAQAEGHVVDPETGEFNRHADQKADHPFLESGGILIESLCWSALNGGDPQLVRLAEQVARFSFEARDPETGLLPVSPRRDRWDKYTATTEVGLWAGCLLRAFQLTRRRPFLDMASDAVRAWLRHAWSATDQRFFGRLTCAGGAPDREPRSTVYQPKEFSDLWEPLFPSHDYPFPCAQACADLFLVTKKETFRIGCERWLTHLEAQWPPCANGLPGAYAEHYGRALHWLITLRDPEFELSHRAEPLMESITEDVEANLVTPAGLLRTHPGEDRCDAVDGAGFLLWSLMEHEAGHRLQSDFDPF